MKTPNISKNKKTPAILYIEARSSKTKPEDYYIDPKFIKNLPKDIFLVYSIQFKQQAEQMKKALEAGNIRIRGFQQVLGCSELKTPYAILLIGQGRFHALNLALQNERPVIIYSNGSSVIVGRKEIEEYRKKKQAALSRFFMEDKIGILVSTKPGQNRLEEAEALKKKLERKYPQKKFFIFISNNINLHEMSNFDADLFINTACPGLSYDSPRILNTDDILPFL